MADVIEVEYKASVDGFKAQLKGVEDSLKKVESTAKDSAQKTEKHFESASHSIKEAGKEIALALGLAFGVEKLVEFGKESVKAFAEAETSANKLKFAVTKIGGEGSVAFNKLLEQAEKLGKTTIFSHKQIEQSQVLLSQFGLTSDQIEKLTPQILDFASATGKDLTSATEQAIQGINGQTRGLKQVGISYEDTGSKTKNLAILTEKLTKFQGSSGEAFLTTAGKAKRFDIAIEDIQESIGKLIVNEGNQLLDFFEGLEKGFDSVNKRAGAGLVQDFLDKQNKIILEKAGESESERQKLLVESDRKILAIAKKGLAETDSLRKEGLKQQLKNEQELNNELRHLNDEHNKVRDDATLKGQADAKTAADELLKAREQAAKDLADFDKKTAADLLAAQAQTDLQKLELVRDTSLEELQIKTDAARKAGVDEATITKSNTIDIANIIGKFNIDKAALDKAAADKAAEQNAKDFQDAIDAADKLGQAEADIVAKQHKKDLDELKKHEEEKKKLQEASFSFLSDAISSITTISNNNNQQRLQDLQDTNNSEIAELDEQLATKQISEKQYNDKKTALLKKQQEEEANLKRAQFESNKQAALVTAIISIAQGVAKTIADLGFPAAIPFIALAAASGALQIAAIESQPTPKFARGVVGLNGKGTGTSDSIHAMLSKGESVITAEQTAKNKDLLIAMNKGKANDYIMRMLIAPALQNQRKEFEKQNQGGFADNIAKSIMLNSKSFYDGNILESLKILRKSDKANAELIAGVIKQGNFNKRKW